MIYYLFSYKEKLPGVNTKVIAKIKALNDLGLPVKGIILYENEKLDLSSFPDKYYDKYFKEEVIVKGLLNEFFSVKN